MLKDKRIPGLILIIFLTVSVFAQTNTDSPYSRFGLGQMGQTGFDQSRALGGIGIGLRNKFQLNHLNPASYTTIDTLSFLFDFGVSGSNSTMETTNHKSTYFAGNLDHLALGFPLSKWWTVSVGVMPYSKVGYSLKEEAYDQGIGFIDYYHSGNGGITQLNLGTAMEFFNRVSVGANFKYLFGNINMQRSVVFPLEEYFSSPVIENSIIIKDFLVELGLQYHQDIGDKLELTLGAIWGNESTLSAENTLLKRNIFKGVSVPLTDSTTLSNEVILDTDTLNGKIDIPRKIGLGFSLNFDNRLLLGVDYTMQDWTDVDIFGQEDLFTMSNSLRTGLQFTPNPEALRGYHKLISYRAGAYYSNSYLKLRGEQLKYYGISFGAGLPLRGGRSSFNIACDLGRRGTELSREGTLNNNLVLENYMFISFSVTLHDIWFFKRKFE